MSDQRDIFGPPDPPTQCFCLHCGRIFMSDLMIAIDVDGERHWMCPVPGCGAMGYCFDIFPTDRSHPDSGWVDDEEIDLGDEDDDFSEMTGQLIADEVADSEGSFDPPTEWTPDSDREDADDEEHSDLDFGRDVFGGPEYPDDDDAEEDVIPPPRMTDRIKHPSRYFTRDDFEQARATGVYDQAIEQEREHWRRVRAEEKQRQARIDRGETLPGDIFTDDDIPF